MRGYRQYKVPPTRGSQPKSQKNRGKPAKGKNIPEESGSRPGGRSPRRRNPNAGRCSRQRQQGRVVDGDDRETATTRYRAAGGQRPRSAAAPSQVSRTTISASERNLPLGTTWKLWSGPSYYYNFFFFFFFLWVREAVLQTDTSKLLYQGPAPTREPTCSLELSLPSPAGIWFKTPLPVGGAKTASQGIGFPKESAAQSFRGRECGVRPWRKEPKEYPLNLQGASCPTWAR